VVAPLETTSSRNIQCYIRVRGLGPRHTRLRAVCHAALARAAHHRHHTHRRRGSGHEHLLHSTPQKTRVGALTRFCSGSTKRPVCCPQPSNRGLVQQPAQTPVGHRYDQPGRLRRPTDSDGTSRLTQLAVHPGTQACSDARAPALNRASSSASSRSTAAAKISAIRRLVVCSTSA